NAVAVVVSIGGGADIVGGRCSRVPRGVDQDKLVSFFRRDSIPEAIVGQPGRPACGMQYQRVRVVTQESFSARVIVGGQGSRLGCRLGKRRNDKGKNENGGCNATK